MKSPVAARHHELSLVFSADDDPWGPDDFLLERALDASARARHINLSDLVSRMEETHVPPVIPYPTIWPGEHYRLLTALVEVCQPKVIIEVGTATGLSALALRAGVTARAAPETLVATFDLIPWRETPQTVLRESDFDASFVQYTDDLSSVVGFMKHQDLVRSADLIFVDAAKDGVMEAGLIQNFLSVPFSGEPLIVFDDIRLWNMLAVWRQMPRPKLDLTSFGHWSGTGLVHWTRSG